MVKVIAVILAMLCVALVVTEVAAVAILWNRGIINPHVLHEMQLIVSDQPGEISTAGTTTSADGSAETAAPTFEQVLRARIVRLLDLQTREKELDLLKKTAVGATKDLIDQQAKFDQEKEQFRKELEALREKLATDSTEQARGILTALAPEEAVARLMGLTLDENIELLVGMPEKVIAKILREFRGEPTRVERGQEIFAGLARGKPTLQILDQAENGQGSAPGGRKPEG